MFAIIIKLLDVINQHGIILDEELIREIRRIADAY